MARAGIYKSEVLRARDNLVAQGRYPSIDAVRSELGNTGSKGTIHRYLKEIEEEEGGATGPKVAISDALQELVARLAARLQDEAETRVAAVNEQLSAERREAEARYITLQQEAQALRTQLQRTDLQLSDERTQHELTKQQSEADRIECSKLQQQVTDLEARLASDAQHLQSLEDKHTQAREALEHFRQATKEQREQAQRQHDQQQQYLQSEVRALNQTLASKQEELTNSHRDNARLTSELSRTQTELHQAQGDARALKRTQDQVAALERQVLEAQQRIDGLIADRTQVTLTNETLEGQLRDLSGKLQQKEVELHRAQASMATQADLLEGFKAHLGKLSAPTSAPAAKI
ncbi:MAG: DNA-binding protein [Steroidobacteraceae bacterium]